MFSCRVGEQLAPTPASFPASHQRVRTRVCGAEGTHADMEALRVPCLVEGAACPACAGSQCSSPPAHPSLPLWALQPPELRAEGGRFLSRWKISLLRSSELSPACHTQSRLAYLLCYSFPEKCSCFREDTGYSAMKWLVSLFFNCSREESLPG